jgi:hypothetical protein
MKYLVLVLIMATFSLKLYSNSDNWEVKSDSLLQNYFEKASDQNKWVFIYFYVDSSGKNLKYGDLIRNENQLNQIDTSKIIFTGYNVFNKENKVLDYNLNLYGPFLDIFDSEGNIFKRLFMMNKIYFMPEETLFNYSFNLTNNYLKKYKEFKDYHSNGLLEGNRLMDYCYILEYFNKLDTSLINEYLNSQSRTDLMKDYNIQFLCHFIHFNHKAIVSWDSHVYDFISEDGKSLLNCDNETIREKIFFFYKDLLEYSVSNLDTIHFNEIYKQISNFENDFGIPIPNSLLENNFMCCSFNPEIFFDQKKLELYSKVDTQKFLELAHSFEKKHSENPVQLFFLAHQYFDLNDSNYNPTILRILEQSNKLDESIGTLYYLAKVNYELGNIVNAENYIIKINFILDANNIRTNLKNEIDDLSVKVQNELNKND